jgi:hypothetical protein
MTVVDEWETFRERSRQTWSGRVDDEVLEILREPIDGQPGQYMPAKSREETIDLHVQLDESWARRILTEAATSAKVTPIRSRRGKANYNPAGVMNRMRSAVEGERNSVLVWCAWTFGRDVLARKVSEKETLEVLLPELAEIAEYVGLAPREINRTIASGYPAGVAGKGLKP